MRTNIPTPKEFSWHLARPECIETTRKEQYLPNCWAVSLASCIGDNFCLTENITAIYPSSIWITSLKNEYLKTYKHPLVNLEKNTNLSIEMLYFLKDNYSISLERCEGKNTLFAIVKNEFIHNKGDMKEFDFEKNASQTILTSELFFECCENCLDIDHTKHTISSCSTTKSGCTDKDEPIYKFKIDLDRSVIIYHNSIFSLLIDEKKIKNTQNIMKNMLCSGPINSQFTVTEEYITYCRRQVNNTTVELFCPLPTINHTEPNHSIEILGWGSESNVEFWYIKDSNFPSFFFKNCFYNNGQSERFNRS